MKKNPTIYLKHIIDCIAKIKEYSRDLDENGFLQNSLVQDAVIRNLEVIGEATKQLDLDFRSKYPDVEWKKIAGMGDKLIHDYIGVDLWAVWGVVDTIIPELEGEINMIIKSEKKVI